MDHWTRGEPSSAIGFGARTVARVASHARAPRHARRNPAREALTDAKGVGMVRNVGRRPTDCSDNGLGPTPKTVLC